MYTNCLSKMNGFTNVIDNIVNYIFTNVWYNTQI